MQKYVFTFKKEEENNIVFEQEANGSISFIYSSVT